MIAGPLAAPARREQPVLFGDEANLNPPLGGYAVVNLRSSS